MRIDNNVWRYSSLCEWHVLLGPDNTQDTLLAMSRAELVSNNRVSGVPNGIAKTHVALILFVTHHSDGLNP